MVKVDVRYDFPQGNPNPFDRNFDAHYFVEASGYSNLGHQEAFGMDALTRHVPIGYKGLAVCRRLYMVRRGEIQEDWRPGADRAPDWSAAFAVLGQREIDRFVPDWGRNTKSYWLSKPGQTDGRGGHWDNLRTCLNDALTLSKERSMRMLVVQVVESHNWH
ncbi:hypothetical protein [Yoonia sp. R2-816]|uniref:hypothetical protein n=1 Tax=Yoonia sp. R2-816 TaxID=3342638 RepID=UPI003728F790